MVAGDPTASTACAHRPWIYAVQGKISESKRETTSLNCKHALAVNCQKREDAGGINAGVDVDPVRSQVGFGDRGVTVHDEFAEVLVAGQKFIADPEQVFRFLLP